MNLLLFLCLLAVVEADVFIVANQRIFICHSEFLSTERVILSVFEVKRRKRKKIG